MMTTDTRTTRRGRPWQMLLLLALLVVGAGRAAARYVDDTYRYSVTLSGSNTITIKAPVYDEDLDDHWVCDGYIYVQVADKDGNYGSKQTLFWWREDESSDGHKNKDTDLWCKFYTEMEGSFDITQGNSGSHFTLTKDDETVRRKVYENNDGETYDFTAVWRVPYNLLGKKLKISWGVKCDYTNGLSWDTSYSVSPSGTEITLPDAQDVMVPQVTMATVSYSEVGRIELPWFMSSTNITAIHYEYVDANAHLVKQDMRTNENNGTLYLDAIVPHNDFKIVVDYKDNNKYDIKGVASTPQDLQMIHAPVGLTATPLSGAEANRKAKVRLEWMIQHRSTDDIAPSDFFEVQRSLTGREADFVTIGSVPLALDTTYFSYVDSTLISALAAEQLTGGGTLDSLTYRVRRMVTQNWGWTGNPCAASARTVLDDLHLLRLKTWSAEWADKRAFTVRVKWEYADEYHAVWDNRAKLMMRVTMKNNAGETVDTKTFELTSDERAARQKVIDLSRPCLKYDIEMYVDPGTSPLKNYEDIEKYYFPIRNVADWNTFRSKVEAAKGQYDVNARLYADISISAGCGTSSSPFRGCFKGNGHTLTTNIKTVDKYDAPFKYAKDYTIEELTVAGNIHGANYSAGLVGHSDGSKDKVNIIRNCRVSATVENSRYECYFGGFIGHSNEANHHITNCLFDGKLMSVGMGVYAAAFIGWGSENADNQLTNCYENGSYEGIHYLAMNFLGGRDSFNGTKGTNNWSANGLDNDGENNAKDVIYIQNASEWIAFAKELNEGKHQTANVKLTADIDLSGSSADECMLGNSDDYAFNGVFDGVGHTLNVNLDKDAAGYIAPFHQVGDCTIKNLRVTGEIKGKYYSSGLIGYTASNANVNIENVRVSAHIYSTSYAAAGIIGYAYNQPKIRIDDCLFDGGMHMYGGVDVWCCAIIGYANYAPGDTWEMHRVYDNGGYYDISKSLVGFCWTDDGWWNFNGKSTNCLTYNYFSQNMGDRYCADQAEVVRRMNAEEEGSWVLLNRMAVPVLESRNVNKVLTTLGSGWHKVDGDILPITHTYSDPAATYPTPTLPDFYHEGNGTISKTLMTETRQSSVVLTWALDDGVVDYFQVYRRLAGATEWGEPIATNIDKMGYEDKTVSPLQNYEYKVVAVTDCEGRHTSETVVKPGSCKHTGRVSGYVRMNDGTGAAGIEVEIAAEGHEADKTTVTTDASGYFMADELSYYGGQSVTYTVTPVSREGIAFEPGRESQPVTFNDKTNDEQLSEFTITSGHRFSGYVMYEGTSIPVKGAHFLVDGRMMHDAANNLVETDYDGSFSFRVLGGNRKIQVTMDGHTFADDGYYKGEAGHYFNDDVAQIYFYDTKKVKLAGRVVGGDDQGRLPLQNNLSRNNLGDKLTMVMTLEGDNTSWLVYDNLNPTLSQRIDTVWHNGGKHRTVVKTQRKRMEVMPDSVTGEYELELPPVRWKVQQVYCDGYATLFQDGQVSEVVDLTKCLNARDSIHEGTFTDVDDVSVYQPRETCHARYSRIYHAPVEITYRQLGYDTFDYFGDKSYMASTVDGTKTEVPLAYQGEIVAYIDSIIGYEDAIVGYEDVELEYENPFDIYTHTPTLTGTSASVNNTGRLYSFLFDNNDLTDWEWQVFPNETAWVEFKSDHLVSVSKYIIRTSEGLYAQSSITPRNWRLMGKAKESDEWTTLAEVMDDNIMSYFEVNSYTYNTSNHAFCRFFRFEFTGSVGNQGRQALAGVSFTCRGKADSKPEDDHGGTYTEQAAVFGKVPVTKKVAVTVGKQVHYTFGHPVFSVGRGYPIEISVGENYLYNNDTRTKKVDRVSLGGGIVNIHNGMKNGTQQDTVRLDAKGQGIYQLFAEATTRLLTSDDALHTVTMTLTQDGTTYEATPLRGYTLNMFNMGGPKDVLVKDKPLLIDILRDPPGGGSSATLSKGSTLKYSYTLDMSLSAGLSLQIGTGEDLDNYTGSVAVANGIGTTAGYLNGAKRYELVDLTYTFDMEGHKAYTYTMNVSQDISTSSEAGMVGADADLYIGMTQNIVTTTYSTIRAITDEVYQTMLGRIGGEQTAGIKNPYGTLVHIAEGTGADGKKYHLIRDESIGYGPEVESQFIHSQKHIITELIPAKIKELRDLMFTGTAADAQAKANATGKPVYRSLRDVNDGRFAMMNMKDGKIYYYTSTMAEDTTMNYVIHLPAGITKNPDDEVAAISQIVYDWVQMLAQNEHEKLAATEHLANYDVDGGMTVNYGEEFESEFDVSNYYHLPGIVGADYFAGDGSDAGTSFASIVGIQAVNTIMKYVWQEKVSKSPTGTSKTGGGNNGGQQGQGQNNGEGRNNAIQTSVEFAGKAFSFSLLPILNYTTKDVSGEAHSFRRKESFNIVMDKLSHLNFDVYRVLTDTTEMDDNGLADVFTNRNFAELTQRVENNLRRGVDIRPDNIRYARSFVYRTRGGATANPWEGERTTNFWQPGTILDERTKKIENPKITVDRQSVSGVPYGETARFTVYLTNDSEDPEAANKTISTFSLYASDADNPYGASITVDGLPLTSSGRSIILSPGQVVTKVVEVSGGNSFDLEGLTIGICSDKDWRRIYDEVTLDVHYLHQAGPVNIATPGDKWVMNTYAEKDDRGWFLPVTIDGFDKHQHNFDHIEFQYKESLRGDDSWTNLCSYYANDSLMNLASGERKMIPENGNIEAHFYGEGTVMEKAYDLRAVLYCRNGNSFLTTSSPIVSGVKDTRRPQLFGTPEPKDGILRLGDNIIFNFSEDIEYNYLNAITNFEVKGEVNNDNVTDAVSLQFTGNGSVESEAQRNFSGKDLTIDLMVRPDKTGRDMPLFSHGTNGKRLQLWLTSDYRLKAIIDDQTFVSTDTIVKSGFTQVAMSIVAPSGAEGGALTFYNGGKQLGSFKMTEAYNGTGRLIFGRTNETDRSKSQYYEGRMMEARLWYRAMTGGQVGTTYGSKRLTGYEMGLVDYYPMNEGTGDYALDKTQGANAQLMGASWAMPRGWSLSLDNGGVALTQQALARTAEQDYTMMFWFKTDDADGTLVSNGSGEKNEAGAENHFWLGFDDGTLAFRSNGMTVEAGSGYNDNQWHHYAMTVNRARGVANIYVDQALKATFSPETLGGISGGHPMIGAAMTNVTDEEGHVEALPTNNELRGNIDELCLFAQALPLTLIKAYATKSPQGDEAGLLTYLAFDRQERQKDNDIETVAYTWSKKIYLDDRGEVRYELDPVTKQATSTPVRDYVFVGSSDEILRHITNETAAPVVPYEELTNLKFSFAGKDNQVLVELDELASRINRRNIYVTLRDVEDKNGNAMVSPQTACYYVTNSSLRWQNERQTCLASYGYEDYIYFDILNNSATSHTYTIENCPRWLDMEAYTGIIGPLGTVTIRGVVNKGLNVGTYDEIIYLTDEDGVAEPLYLNLTVTTSAPEWSWSVDEDLLKYSMNIAGQVILNGEVDIDSRDIVGVFDQENRCHGIAHVNYSALTGESDLYLTVYDSSKKGTELYFKIWQYSTGRELVLTADGKESMTFRNDSIVGVDTPVRFEGGSLYVQTFDLKEGWNWVSFNVASEKLFNLNTLLGGLPWENGDVLTEMSGNVTMTYKNGTWLATGDVKNLRISPRKGYAIKVAQDIAFPVGGSIIKSEDTRTITVSNGWNGIGYTPILNLSVETALSDYYDNATPGDIIKSHSEFAYFTKTGGTGRWRGNLQYMKPGEGYMLLRKAEGEASFRYPFYEPGSTFLDAWAVAGSRGAAEDGSADVPSASTDVNGNDATVPAASPLDAHRYRHTMSLTAVIEGFEPEEGDLLVAYADGEQRGFTTTVLSGSAAEESEPLYLNIGGEKQADLWFAIERNGDIVASTGNVLTFRVDDVVGSPDEPFALRFAASATGIDTLNADQELGKWYTVNGIELPQRPTRKGVYIYNGNKIVIK